VKLEAFRHLLVNAPIRKLGGYPTFPVSNAVATHSEGPYPVAPVVVSEALIGSWTQWQFAIFTGDGSGHLTTS
jgi:hypothetical protein